MKTLEQQDFEQPGGMDALLHSSARLAAIVCVAILGVAAVYFLALFLISH